MFYATFLKNVSKHSNVTTTFLMFSGGDWNAFRWSADASDECKGRIQSDDTPPKRNKAVNLSTSNSISATPYRKNQKYKLTKRKKRVRLNLQAETTNKSRLILHKAYRKENKNGTRRAIFINIAYQIFQKIKINCIFI